MLLFQSEDYDVVSPISEDTFRNLRDNPDEATDDEIEDPFEYIDTEVEQDLEEEEEEAEQEAATEGDALPPAQDATDSTTASQQQKTSPLAKKKTPRKRSEPKRDRAMGLLLHLQPNLSYPVMNHTEIGPRSNPLMDSVKKFGVKRKKAEEAKEEMEAKPSSENGEAAISAQRETDMEITPETDAAGQTVAAAAAAAAATDEGEVGRGADTFSTVETQAAVDVMSSVVAAEPQASELTTEGQDVILMAGEWEECGLAVVETSEIKDLEESAGSGTHAVEDAEQNIKGTVYSVPAESDEKTASDAGTANTAASATAAAAVKAADEIDKEQDVQKSLHEKDALTEDTGRPEQGIEHTGAPAEEGESQNTETVQPANKEKTEQGSKESATVRESEAVSKACSVMTLHVTSLPLQGTDRKEKKVKRHNTLWE